MGPDRIKPVHFFANSVIGPSVHMKMPGNVSYSPVSQTQFQNSSAQSNNFSSPLPCWIIFRTGDSSGWKDLPELQRSDAFSLENSYTSAFVNYSSPACEPYRNSSTFEDLGPELHDFDHAYPLSDLRFGNCSVNYDVTCKFQDVAPSCRLTIRMSAALILAGCLLIKSCYMIAVNVQGRQRKKTQCLTFGDVIVASVMDSALCVQNECLVNAGEAYRDSTSHSCHKHCKAKVISESGDELGHCQKCRKFNQVNKAADLLHPCIATKYKKSLLSNLGSAALFQMITLSIASTVMLGGSISLAIFFRSAATYFEESCRPGTIDADGHKYCNLSLKQFLDRHFGSFGGFDSTARIGALSENRGSSEILAFAISNGAQLLYSLLYLLLIYNFTLISMEHDWGQLEKQRLKLRCTIVRGTMFRQSYLLQLPKKVLYPMMVFSSMMHWLLGQAISTKEYSWTYEHPQYARNKEFWEVSKYLVRLFLIENMHII